MGAMPWQEIGPWREDPNESLRILQSEYLAEKYDLPTLIRQRLESLRTAVRLTEAEGDPYNILKSYKSDQAFLERAASEPLPESPEARISLLREICESSGEGIGDVLDVHSASSEGGHLTSRILSDAELHELVGTVQPTREMASTVFAKLIPRLDRGESVCFRVFTGDGKPSGWCFAGYSID